jgi:hypothetical protein
MRRVALMLSLATLVGLTATVEAQPGRGGPPSKGSGGRGGPGGGDEISRLQEQIERLKTHLREAEERLQHLKRGSRETAGGFGGHRGGFGSMHGFGMHPGSFGSFSRHDGFGTHRGSMSGSQRHDGFGSHHGFGPPHHGTSGGFGGIGHRPGSSGGSSIERKLEHIQQEINELRREIHGGGRR